MHLSQKRKLGNVYKSTNLFFETYNYDARYENEESTDKEESTDLFDMPSLEGDEEINKRKRIKILTPNKFLTRIPILLAQIKSGNNSDNLKN